MHASACGSRAFSIWFTCFYKKKPVKARCILCRTRPARAQGFPGQHGRTLGPAQEKTRQSKTLHVPVQQVIYQPEPLHVSMPKLACRQMRLHILLLAKAIRTWFFTFLGKARLTRAHRLLHWCKRKSTEVQGFLYLWK
jgi:hypothetical protein